MKCPANGFVGEEVVSTTTEAAAAATLEDLDFFLFKEIDNQLLGPRN